MNESNELSELRAEFRKFAGTLPGRSFTYIVVVFVMYTFAPENTGLGPAFIAFGFVFFPPADLWEALRSYLRRNEEDS